MDSGELHTNPPLRINSIYGACYDIHGVDCHRCENKAIYTRRYSGESLCRDCFSLSIVRKTAKTISRYNMIKRGDDVAIAVSGGKDSLSLLHVLNNLSTKGGYTIRAVTIDEGIPGYREEALEIVDKYCKGMGIQYSVLSYKQMYDTTLQERLEKRTDSTSSCSLCGVLRRQAIEQAAAGADVVATAHNMDDYIQTFLINTMSGDVSRIGRNVVGTSRRVQPFCNIYESEIVFYAFINDIPFQSEPCPHMDEGIRTSVREFLNELEEKHSGIKNNMNKSIQKIAGFVQDAKVRRTCRICGRQSTTDVCSVCRVLERTA